MGAKLQGLLVVEAASPPARPRNLGRPDTLSTSLRPMRRNRKDGEEINDTRTSTGGAKRPAGVIPICNKCFGNHVRPDGSCSHPSGCINISPPPQPTGPRSPGLSGEFVLAKWRSRRSAAASSPAAGATGPYPLGPCGRGGHGEEVFTSGSGVITGRCTLCLEVVSKRAVKDDGGRLTNDEGISALRLAELRGTRPASPGAQRDWSREVVIRGSMRGELATLMRLPGSQLPQARLSLWLGNVAQLHADPFCEQVAKR